MLPQLSLPSPRDKGGGGGTIAADICRAPAVEDPCWIFPDGVVPVVFPFDSWGNIGSGSSNLVQDAELEESGAGT